MKKYLSVFMVFITGFFMGVVVYSYAINKGIHDLVNDKDELAAIIREGIEEAMEEMENESQELQSSSSN